MVNQKNKQTFSPPQVGGVLWRTRPNAMCILTSPVQSVQLILRFTINDLYTTADLALL